MEGTLQSSPGLPFKSSLLVARRGTAKSSGSLANDHQTAPPLVGTSTARRKSEKVRSMCLYFLSLLLVVALLCVLVNSLVTSSSAHPPLGASLRRNHSPLTLRPTSADPRLRKQAISGNHIDATTPNVLLTTPELCTITADVRGNLGPATVMLNDGTDWLKDRWQAASDMGGTAIRGRHWVQLDFSVPIVVHSVRLDWETAYSDHYQLLARIDQAPGAAAPDASGRDDPVWSPIFTAPSERIRVNETGTSPGFTKVPMPLHVVHTFELEQPSAATRSVRLLILSSATGWGVSLWRIEMYGTRQDVV